VEVNRVKKLQASKKKHKPARHGCTIVKLVTEERNVTNPCHSNGGSICSSQNFESSSFVVCSGIASSPIALKRNSFG